MSPSVGSLAVVIALIAAGGTQPSLAATFHFVKGINDSFMLPTEPASPSPQLINLVASLAPFQNYDEPVTVVDRTFLETIDGLPMCITTANLTLRIRPGNGGSDNDAISLFFLNNSGGFVGPTSVSYIGNPSLASGASLLAPPWDTSHYGPTLINMNLASLPNIGGPMNLVPALDQFKHLDLLMQDDTNIDYLDLTLTTQLAGDIDGDGCVDANDLALLITNFGLVTPNGVGDPNGDGVLNIQDLAIVQADFGKCSCPEPTSAVLTLMGLTALVFTPRNYLRR